MKKNPLEWSVFGAGLILLFAVLGYLGWQAARPATDTARFSVRLGEPQVVEGGFRTRVTVENLSDATTRAVKVEVGKAELDLDYVPRHSKREGFVVTETAPKEGRVVSWQDP